MLVALAGCATNTGVIQTGPNTFTISVEREVMLGGRSEARRVAFTDAGAACRSRGQQVQILAARPFASSIAPETGIDLQFACMPAGSVPAVELTF